MSARRFFCPRESAVVPGRLWFTIYTRPRRRQSGHQLAHLLTFDLQSIEHACNVMRLRFLVVTAFGAGRQPYAAQIGCDDGVVAGEFRRQRPPHIAGLSIAMEQDDRWPLTTDTDMEGCAVCLDFLGAKVSRLRLNLRRSGQR